MISWLSDDDLLLPDHLERVGEYWDGGVADIVQAPTVAVAKDDSLTWIGLDWSMPVHMRTMLEVNTNAMSAVSVRVQAAVAAGGWDAGVPSAGDWDLWKRLIAAGARPVMTGEPTVLHFRAAGREHPWPLRVRQNTEWFERIADAGARADLRFELRALRAVREADWTHAIDSLSNQIEQARQEADRRSESERTLNLMLQRERAETERLREVERTLGLVYSGGWWRLRGRLLAALSFLTQLYGLVRGRLGAARSARRGRR